MDIPEIFQNGYYNNQFTSEKRLADSKNADNFAIEDLLDIPNDEYMVADDGGPNGAVTTESSNVTVADVSCNSSFITVESCYNNMVEIGTPDQFSSEICVPYDDVGELEWLSNFVEESFSTGDLHKMQMIHGMKVRTNENSSETHHYQFHPETRPGQMFRPEKSVPAKARSKRSRAAPRDWTSRLLVVSPTPSADVSCISSASDSDCTTMKKTSKPCPMKKKEVPENSESRRCLHCATDKTPQWRTGPMGPKTLCNACGVRYKSGRLVPEYRPASSPTFVLAKHSNSHRKVIELRRQKEMQRDEQHQQRFVHHQNRMFDVPNGEDYLIHQRIGHGYRQLI